ncbi:unnamed protein product [Closterium sp. NIES-53]
MGALIRFAFVLALPFVCLSSLHMAVPPQKLDLLIATEIDASSVRASRKLLEYEAAAVADSADSVNLNVGISASGGGEEEEVWATMDDGVDESGRELLSWNEFMDKLKNARGNFANDVKNGFKTAKNNITNGVSKAVDSVKKVDTAKLAADAGRTAESVVGMGKKVAGEVVHVV